MRIRRTAIRKGVHLSTTLWLIIINSIFFLIAYPLITTKQEWIKFIAIQPSYILQGKYLWTILTSMFMHAGFFHLFINMISLFFLGSFLEKIIGKKRFLFSYFVCGISASVLFVLSAMIFKKDLTAMAVGASGAIFGLAGLIAILTPKLKVYIMPLFIPIQMWLAAIISLGILWLASLTAKLPIGNTAHLGGLLAGLFIGIYLRLRYKKKIKMLNRYLGLR